MGGADLIVFTGGVGENDFVVRDASAKIWNIWVSFSTNRLMMEFGQDIVISKPESKVKVAAVATNEELVIASDTFRLLKKRSE